MHHPFVVTNSASVIDARPRLPVHLGDAMPFSLPAFLTPSLPSLPPALVPASLQRRLLSYLLKRFVGPLLQDGGARLDDVDAGTLHVDVTRRIEITELLFDPQALRRLLAADLPIDFTSANLSTLLLHVVWPATSWTAAVRAPWDSVPEVTLELSGIRLGCVLNEGQASTNPRAGSDVVEGSILHVAEDFVREELNPAEQTELDQSFMAQSHHGALDDRTIPGDFTSMVQAEPLPDDLAGKEVGFFATLVDRMMAKIQVNVSDVVIDFSDTHGGLRLEIDSIKSVAHPDPVYSVLSRRVTISSPRIYFTRPSEHLIPLETYSDSGSSSMDSGDDMLMSQAIPDLRQSVSHFPTLETPQASLEQSSAGSDVFWSVHEENRSSTTVLQSTSPMRAVSLQDDIIIDFGIEDIILDLGMENSVLKDVNKADLPPHVVVQTLITKIRVSIRPDQIISLLHILERLQTQMARMTPSCPTTPASPSSNVVFQLTVAGLEVKVSYPNASTNSFTKMDVHLSQNVQPYQLCLCAGEITLEQMAEKGILQVKSMELYEIGADSRRPPVINIVSHQGIVLSTTSMPSEVSAVQLSWSTGALEAVVAPVAITVDPDFIARLISLKSSLPKADLHASSLESSVDEMATERGFSDRAPTPSPTTTFNLNISCSSIRIGTLAGSPLFARGGAAMLELQSIDVLHSTTRSIITCERVRFDGRRPILSVEPVGASAIEIQISSAYEEPKMTRFATGPSEDDAGPLSVVVSDCQLTLCKEDFDGLQYWMDDVTNWASRLTTTNTKLDFSARRTDPSPASTLSRPSDVAEKSPFAVKVQRARCTLDLGDAHQIVAEVADVSLAQIVIPGRPHDTRLKIVVRHLATSVGVNGETRSLVTRLRSQSNDPILALETATSASPTSSKKKALIKVSLVGLLVKLEQNCVWVGHALKFLKAPAEVFEGVEPNDVTKIEVDIVDVALDFETSDKSSKARLHFTEFETSVSFTQTSPIIEPTLKGSLALWAVGNYADGENSTENETAQLVKLLDLSNVHLGLELQKSGDEAPSVQATLRDGFLTVGLCADTAGILESLSGAMSSICFGQEKLPDTTSELASTSSGEASSISDSLIQSAMRDPADSLRALLSEAAEDLGDEDYPQSLHYLQAGKKLRKGRTPQLDTHDVFIQPLHPNGLNILHNFLQSDESKMTKPANSFRTQFDLVIEKFSLTLGLHDGYDWDRTRRSIENERKVVRKRLEKIRQLLAQGLPADDTVDDELSTTVFNSVHVGLQPSNHDMDEADLMSAIDKELMTEMGDDIDDMSLASSWQTLPANPKVMSSRPTTTSSGNRKSLKRSRKPALAFMMQHITGRIRTFEDAAPTILGVQIQVDELSIVDNIKTSTWNKFLTEMRTEDGGLPRPTGEPMVRFAFALQRPSLRERSQEIVFRLKLLPIRLYVDQDAVDFLKAFGAFKDTSDKPESQVTTPAPAPFFQRVEIYPIRIKLDYKPKRVDYKALRAGKTVELMNFFHFEGSDMTLRHAVLTGISGADRVGDMLQDIWTPDVKANQLADVISGVAPIRSVVNIGTGVADLVLLPIEQVRKDGRLARGLQKGTRAFAKSTALEAINLGARLATGTQVILEKAESILGARLGSDIRGETINFEEVGEGGQISRYAQQPANAKEGVKVAYRQLSENLRSTAQTILAVPLEVFNEGTGKAVVKAIPIALLHPMVGATGAISKTLLGVRHSLDAGASVSDQDKYKTANL